MFDLTLSARSIKINFQISHFDTPQAHMPPTSQLNRFHSYLLYIYSLIVTFQDIPLLFSITVSSNHIFSSIFFLDENAPCIGICYHNKLKSLEEGRGDYSRGWPLNAKDFGKEFGPPCVGLCYVYREMNMMNMTNPGDPFQKNP